MEQLQRIRYVTRYFEELQGYRLLPFVAFYLAGAAYDATLPLLFDRAPIPVAVGTALLMFLSFVVCAVASHHVGQSYVRRYGLVRGHFGSAPRSASRKGWWWVAVEPWRPADRSHRRVASFSTETWWWLVSIVPLLGFHKFFLGLLGSYLVWRLVTQHPLPMRHVPHAVLYLALAVHFPGLDSGILSGPETAGLNAYVVKDLILAALLGWVALSNHRALTRALDAGTRRAQDELHG